MLQTAADGKIVVPFGEEVSYSIHQQEHLFLSPAAVSCVQIMLQRHRSLHRADHVNMFLLYTTGDRSLRGKKEKCICHSLVSFRPDTQDGDGCFTNGSLIFMASGTYPIHSLNSRAFGTVALSRMILTWSGSIIKTSSHTTPLWEKQGDDKRGEDDCYSLLWQLYRLFGIKQQGAFLTSASLM